MIKALEKRQGWLYFGGLVLLALIVFRTLLLPGSILLTTDDNIGAMAMRENLLPYGFLGGWDDSILVGNPNPLSITWTNLLLWLLPLKFFINWIHAFDLVLGSLFFGLFLRRRSIGWIGCAVGALAAYWVGSNFTLTYAGHTGKFGVLFFAGLYCWLAETAVQRRSALWGLLAGGAMGGMFLEQADLALFFAIVLGPYTVYAVIREAGRDFRQLALVLVPLVLLSGLMSFRPLYDGYRAAVKGVASVDEQSPEEKWDFITQWSWPPEESIDFIAPGYMGWRSGEATGPYWGRMGRSAGWKETGQGFRNFKLENQYVGIFPLVLMLWAVLVSHRRREEDRKFCWDMRFWAIAFVVTLVLSFGKYFPLYRLFYMLPGVSSIRNPNKFLQVWQLVLGVGAAYGVDAVLGQREKLATADLWPFRRKFSIGVGVLGVILILWGMSVTTMSAGLEQGLQKQGWGQMAGPILDTKSGALWWGGIMTILCAVFLWVSARREGKEPDAGIRKVLTVVLVLLLAGDAVALSNRYINTMSKTFIADNVVVQYLKANMGSQRASMLTQGGFYNIWLTYLFPYHDIDTLNVAQMPRMPADYKAFLGSVGRNAPRMWQLCSVGYILSPIQGWAQIQNDPALKENYELVFGYNVFPTGDGGVEATVGTQQQPGREVIIHPKLASDRYALVGAWEEMAPEAALRTLSSPTFQPLEKVLLEPGASSEIPFSASEGVNEIGSVKVKQYRPGRIQLQVSAQVPAILRVGEKYAPEWRAVVNNQAAPVLRTDYLFCGVPVPAGLYEVELIYAPSRLGFYIQMLAMLACLGALGVLFFSRPDSGNSPFADSSDEK